MEAEWYILQLHIANRDIFIMKTIHVALIGLALAAGSCLAADNPPATTIARPAPAVPPCMQNTNSATPCQNVRGMPQSMRPSAGPGMRGRMMANPSNAAPGMRGGMMGNPSSMGPGMRGSTPAAAGQQKTQVFGWQLMTPAERDAYRIRMRAAKTPEERARIRAEHHQEMLKRAKERGVTLPEVPPVGN